MRREEFNLRPIEQFDLDMVLTWRNSERVRSYMYTDHIISPEEHRAWFDRIGRAGFATTLIFEYKGVPAGLKSFSHIDRYDSRCHWGFYLCGTEFPRGFGAIMGYLALEYIFDQHNFRKLCAEVFAYNEGSLKYHTRLGFVQEGRFVRHILKNEKYEDIISLALFREAWIKEKSSLAAKLFTDENPA